MVRLPRDGNYAQCHNKVLVPCSNLYVGKQTGSPLMGGAGVATKCRKFLFYLFALVLPNRGKRDVRLQCKIECIANL